MKNSEVAKMCNISESLVSRVRRGKVKSPKSEVILAALDIETHLLNAMKTDLFAEMCDVAISKSKNNDVRKLATLMQHWSLGMRNGESK